MPEQGTTESGLKRLAATLGKSAEYSIALGLIVVCLVVGGALWFLDGDGKSSDSGAVSTPVPGQDGSKIADEEKAALEGWNQQLQGDLSKIEQAQRRAAEEAAQRERQRQEAEREARAAAEQERQRAQAVPATAEPKRTQLAVATLAPTAKPTKAAVRVEPKIDWSTCRRPEYPASSVKRKEQGSVAVDVNLDATGKVLSSKIAESSSHSKLDTVTQRAIEKCRFSPATVDGVAEPATALVRFAWKLQD